MKLVVREIMIAKPGYAGKLAKMMKDEMKNWKDFKGYVLLDFVTNYNTIVVEYELDSLATFEKMMVEMKAEQAKQKSEEPPNGEPQPPEYTKYYLTGRREIYKVVE